MTTPSRTPGPQGRNREFEPDFEMFSSRLQANRVRKIGSPSYRYNFEAIRNHGARNALPCPLICHQLETDYSRREVIVFSSDEFRRFAVEILDAMDAMDAMKIVDQALQTDEAERVAAAGKTVVVPTVAPIKDLIGNVIPALRKIGYDGKAYIRTYKGEEYVVLKGYAGIRKLKKYLDGTRYLTSNVKVVDLVIGESKVMKSTRGTFVVSIAFVCVADLVGAILSDEELDLLDLSLTIGVDISKTAVASSIGALAAIIVGSTIGAPVVAALGIGIVVGFVVGIGLDYFFPTDDLVKVMYDKLGGIPLLFPDWRQSISTPVPIRVLDYLCDRY